MAELHIKQLHVERTRTLFSANSATANVRNKHVIPVGSVYGRTLRSIDCPLEFPKLHRARKGKQTSSYIYLYIHAYIHTHVYMDTYLLTHIHTHTVHT